MPKTIPFRAQVTMADCGASCLAMVLEHFGKVVPLEELRATLHGGRDGVSALDIAAAATYYGLRARGVQAEVEHLPDLPRGTLLFWDLNHFVVHDGASRRGVRIVDPANGKRTVPWAEVDKSFTGVAILLEPGARFTKGAERVSGAKRFLSPLLAQRAALGRILVTSFVLRGLALALPLLTAALLDRVVPSRDPGLLRVLGICLAGVVAYTFLGQWLRSRLLLELRTVVDAQTTMTFLDHLFGLPLLFHLRRSSGDLLARLRSNTVVREILTTSALAAAFDGTFALLYLALLFALSPVIGLVAVALAVVQVSVLLSARVRLQHAASEGLKAEARAQSYAVEMLYGIGTLKASGTEHRAIEQFGHIFADELTATVRRGRLSALLDSANATLTMASPLVVLTFAGAQVLGGSLTIGVAFAANALAVGFLSPLGSLVTSGVSMATLRGYVERLNDVFDTPLEQEADSVRPAPELSGAIEAENVSFRYSPLSPLVVKDANLRIEPGQTVALVGRSGSGKTTLASILVGLYPPTEGVVRHDGHDLATLSLPTVRAQAGVVTQEPYLFGMSIRDNIAFADPSLTLEDVRRAAALACIDDDVARLPMGYDTMLGEGGASLSGGQRQRLALARALVGSPKVVLLDEATSHLDAVTEAEVHARLRELRCTVIVVAHRLSTVTHADLIAVVDDGCIVERGTHDELLAAGGAYATLVRSQLSEPAPARRAAPAAHAKARGARRRIAGPRA